MDKDLDDHLVRIDFEITEIRRILDRETAARRQPETRASPMRTIRDVKADSAPVVITDLNMSFVSMVTFMVKWVFAVIPALLILMIIGGVVVGVLPDLFKQMFNQ